MVGPQAHHSPRRDHVVELELPAEDRRVRLTDLPGLDQIASGGASSPKSQLAIVCAIIGEPQYDG